MAPAASSSRSKQRRDRSPSSDGDNGAQANGDGRATPGGALAAELDALELQNPSKTCRHLFIQTLMARKQILSEMAKELYSECVRLCKVDSPKQFETFIAELEPGLSLCGLDIKLARNQETGESSYVLVNTISDDPSKLATEYKAEEVAFFKAIVEKIMTAKKLSYSITQMEALRCAKQPLSKTHAGKVLKSFLARGWLSLHSSGRLVLSSRTLVELENYLADTFGHDDEEDDDPHDRAIAHCNFCSKLVASGYACPNEDCGIRLHTYCVAQQVTNDTGGRCPDRLQPKYNCQQVWPRDSSSRKFHGQPVGVAALQNANDDEDDDEEDATMEDSPATSRKGGRWSSLTNGKEGKGKGKKKGNREDSNEEEDELMDEDDDGTAASTSPAATRRSSGRAAASKAKRRVNVPSDDEDDDEE
ncbi:hypothetical protein JCM8547_003056 [Rhodosporidiobolus lusitaniae]